jgi:preprotein translocase subunit SecA
MKKYLEMVFGTESTRVVKKYKKVVEKINAFEESLTKMSQDEMRARISEFQKELKELNEEGQKKKLTEILPEVFAFVREASKRVSGERHYDVQLIGGQVLFHRGIAEMRTGEGKTLVATLPVFLFALAGRGVHVVTVNDYLARRDAAWMGQVYNYLGLSVGVIGRDTSYKYSEISQKSEADKERDAEGSFKVEYEFLKSISRREAYDCDITYGTNSEFGFDYLRDNLVYEKAELVQREHYVAIVDEVDSILIDESRTPLIISSSAGEEVEMYKYFANIANTMYKDIDFVIEEKEKQSTLTAKGVEKVEKQMGIENLYAPGNARLVHNLLNAVRAKAIFTRDKEYVVKDDEVIIVDEFTGRLKPGNRWSEGLHQAVEAKENVKIQKESKTVASITYQNYFRMYKNLSGMTGTGSTSKEEFVKVYDLNVISVPTHRGVKRDDKNDVVYQDENAKWLAIARRIKELNIKGQPVLIGTTSIEKNEKMATYLEREKVPFEILNAKNHEREGEIIANAGKKGSVVVATNMAGRGVDIKLGGPLSTKKEKEEIISLGGLAVIGTERHEARRIDNQLRGRSGRQGDVGETQFFVSLEDEIMKRFGGEKMQGIMKSLNVPAEMPIESGMIGKMIESAQTKIEGYYFDMRKNVLQYDTVLNIQRESVYSKRKRIIAEDEILITEYLEKIQEIKPEIKELGEKVKLKFGEVEFKKGFRAVLLQNIDIHWMSHLDTMEHLRSSVGLRGYGQHDPLVEYKKESLDLFKAMEQSIFKNSASMLFNSMESAVINSGITTNVEQPLPSFGHLPNGKDSSPDVLADNNLIIKSNGFSSESSALTLEQMKNGGKNVGEIGRNDVCPCGSGKKYKKCHGA